MPYDRSRVAICAFDGESGLSACLDAVRIHGVDAGDLFVLDGSGGAGPMPIAEAALGVLRGSDWLPPDAFRAVTRDLEEHHRLLFIRGNPSMIEALMVDILLNTPALRVEVHDLPARGAGG